MKKIRNAVLLFAALAFTAILSGCSGDMYEGPGQIDVPEYSTYDDEIYQQYYEKEGEETDGSAATSTAIMENTESLIAAISNFLPSVSGLPEIHMTSDIQEYRIGQDSITISLDTINTFGWLAFALSATETDNHLPIWLAAGIEALAASQIGIFTPYDAAAENLITGRFGDLNFIPVAWEGNHQEAIDTAYHFARYLQDGEHLAALISLYADSYREAADYMAAELFYSFAGGTMESGTRLDLLSGYAPGIGHYGYRIVHIHSSGLIMTHALYQDFTEGFRAGVIREQFNSVNRIMQRVVNWFGEYIDVDHLLPHKVYLAYWGQGGGFYHDEDGGATIVTGIRRVDPQFDPGTVPYWILYHFFTDYFNDKLAGDIPPHPLMAQGLGIFIDQELRPTGTLRWAIPHSGVVRENILERDDFEGIVGYTDHDYLMDDGRIAIIYSSFVRYLIETYGPERYLQIHWTFPYGFEEVYGMTIQEMSESWIEFIRGWDV